MGLLDTWQEWKDDFDPYYQKGKEKVLGKENVVAGKTMNRSGGLVGEGGVLDTAGGYAKDKALDYSQGEERLSSSPGSINKHQEITRPGFKSSQLNKDIGTVQDKVHQGLKQTVEYGVDKGNQLLSFVLGEDVDTKSISKSEKDQLIAGYKAGQVDPALVAALKNKTGPINNNDIGTLQKVIGVDMDTAKANWKDKGGMEGLMSNPAFTLGLALMQSSANGKTINQGILDNFVKSAKISEHYKDRIKARGSIIGPPTDDEIGQAESILKSMKLGGPGIGGWVKDFLGGETNAEDYRAMVSNIASENKKRAAELKGKGKKVEMNADFMKETMKIMKNKGQLNIKSKGKRKGFASQFNIFQTKIKQKEEEDIFKARGGPVRANKAYVVGEQGPEYFLPKESGKVVSNDDSRIFAMLLAANPQLQQVSKTRAERIIRSRFPEYFD